MKVSDLLQTRQANWQELEQLCGELEGASRRRVAASTAGRFCALYRAACADLALADAYQLPPGMVRYLHQLVGRAHNQLYRAETFHLGSWYRELFVRVPRRLFSDNYLRLAFAIFWGVFLLSMALAYYSPPYARKTIGEEQIEFMEESFSGKLGRGPGLSDMSGLMVGFYIFHNIGIGLRCFAFGIVFGVGGLYELVFNAAVLGAMFGHMSTVPQSENFYHFVTAHGPFELTAIVLSAAAGMRLGFSLVQTHGLTRGASLRRAVDEAMPVMAAAVLMFALAALIEAFLSPSRAPYEWKAGVAVLSSAMLMWYFVILGYPREEAT